MQIRNYQPGDEQAQAQIYNAVAGMLPRFKPATAEEIARRYAADADPSSRFYALVDGQIIGYAVFNPNGRISYPWCVAHAEEAQPKLLGALLGEMRRRGIREAWATYRADWKSVLGFLTAQNFATVREMINYVTEVALLPTAAVSGDSRLASLAETPSAATWEIARQLFQGSPEHLEKFYLANPHFSAESVFVLSQSSDPQPLGVGVAICNPQFADPAKLDAAMPCFRLGAIGTEAERHKRVNGMFSCAFRWEKAGEILLAEAARRFRTAGLTHAAAQAASDRPELVAFFDRHFKRQGAFPILARRLSG